MSKKILIANRGESVRAAGVSAKPNRTKSLSAKTNCSLRAAHAGELPAEATHV